MDQLSLGDINLLFFVLPGFMIVWSFRYFTHSKKTGDFELLGLSFVLGILSLIGFEMYVHFICWTGWHWVCPSGNALTEIQAVLANPYGFAGIFTLSGIPLGWIGAWVSSQRCIQSKLSKLRWNRKNNA
jgi:hypothetical protein